MADLYKRPNSPFWWLSATLPDGRRVRLSTGLEAKREAQRYADKRVAELSAEAALPGSPISLESALGRYVAKLRAAGKTSAWGTETLTFKTIGKAREARPSDARMAARRLLQGAYRPARLSYHLDPDMPLHTLRGEHLMRLHADRVAGGNSLQTANHEVKTIRAAISHAKALGFKVPELVIKLEAPPTKTRYLSWEEFELLFAHLDPDRPIKAAKGDGTFLPTGEVRREKQDAQDLLLALVLTGGRWSEVATLTWDMFDTVGWSHIRLYGWKDQQERLVPIPAQAQAMFRRRHAARGNAMLVFPGKSPDKVRGGPSRAISTAMDACGLNPDRLVTKFGRATIHSLRHTFASWLLQRGLTLSEVQQLLGHASSTMTERYTHLAVGQTVNRAAEALSRGAD